MAAVRWAGSENGEIKMEGGRPTDRRIDEGAAASRLEQLLHQTRPGHSGVFGFFLFFFCFLSFSFFLFVFAWQRHRGLNIFIRRRQKHSQNSHLMPISWYIYNFFVF